MSNFQGVKLQALKRGLCRYDVLGELSPTDPESMTENWLDSPMHYNDNERWVAAQREKRCGGTKRSR